MADLTQEQEFEFRLRMEQEQEAEAAAAAKKAPAKQVDPNEYLYKPVATGVGVLGAELLGPGITQGVENVQKGRLKDMAEANRLAKANIAAQNAPVGGTQFNPRGVSPQASAANWEAYNDLQQQAANRANRTTAMQKKFPNFQRPGAGQALAGNAPATPAAAPSAPVAKGSQLSKDTGRFLKGLGARSYMPFVGRALAGASAGVQGADAWNRAKDDDYAGAVISGLGSLGSAASLVPIPLVRGVGTAASVAAPMINDYRDKLKRGEIKHENFTNESVDPMGSGFAAGGAIQGYANLGSVKKALGAAANKVRTLVEPTAEEIAAFVPKPTQQGKFSDFIQNHMGEYLGVHQSDRLGTHGNYKGGTGFTNFQNIDPLHAKNEVVWMNNDPKAANKLTGNTTFNDKDVIWTNYIGKENQHKSNRGVFNEILADVYKNNPNISEEQALKIAQRMKTLTGKDLDIRDKFLMQELGGDTFDSRGKLADMFGLGFGRGKDKLVLSPNYQRILDESAEEFTKGAPTSAIGTRLHRIYDEPSQYSTMFHPDYDYTVHGKDMGVQFPAVPHTLLDWTQKYIKEGRGGKGSELPHGNAWMNYMTDPQYIDDTFVKRAQSEGFAMGGAIKGYAGGEIVKKIAQAGLKALDPQETVKAYKLFKTKPNAPGELFPLFVNANKPVPVGEWVNAEVGPMAASGKVKSKLGELAYRPGWHAGDLPVATHIGGKSDPKLRAPDYRRPDEVWAEVEMPNDVDWQTIANERARLNKAGEPIASTAHITDQIPEGGFYRYKTSPNMKGNWLIGGSMKVNKVLTPEEVQAINDAAGVSDLPLYELLKKAAGGYIDNYAEGGHTTPAWQRSEGKNPEGGLNAVGRASYNRETGGNLKAPQPEGGPRKDSFCARMEGMKKKNTSAKTANDPDSRINKSLRKWKC